LLLRSAEAKLLCYRFVQLCWTSLPFCTWLLRAKTAWFEPGQMASRTGMRRMHEWRKDLWFELIELVCRMHEWKKDLGFWPLELVDSHMIYIDQIYLTWNNSLRPV